MVQLWQSLYESVGSDDWHNWSLQWMGTSSVEGEGENNSFSILFVIMRK